MDWTQLENDAYEDYAPTKTEADKDRKINKSFEDLHIIMKSLEKEEAYNLELMYKGDISARNILI